MLSTSWVRLALPVALLLAAPAALAQDPPSQPPPAETPPKAKPPKAKPPKAKPPKPAPKPEEAPPPAEAAEPEPTPPPPDGPVGAYPPGFEPPPPDAPAEAAPAEAGPPPEEPPPGYGYPPPPYYAPPPGYGYGPLPHGPPPPRMRRNNTGMMAAGIVLTSIGAVGAVVGASLASAAEQEVEVRCSQFECYEEAAVDEDKRTAGIVVALSGLALVGVGIPLIVVGARKVPVEEEAPPGTALVPEVRVSPVGGGLTWRF